MLCGLYRAPMLSTLINLMSAGVSFELHSSASLLNVHSLLRTIHLSHRTLGVCGNLGSQLGPVRSFLWSGRTLAYRPAMLLLLVNSICNILLITTGPLKAARHCFTIVNSLHSLTLIQFPFGTVSRYLSAAGGPGRFLSCAPDQCNVTVWPI